MHKIHARTLLNYTPDQLFNTLFGKFTLIFDDGELLVSGKETVYSRYFWEFHERYPNTPLKKEHHVSTILKGGLLNSSTHIQLLGVIYKEVAITYNQLDPHQRDDLTRFVYQVTNKIYNELSMKCEPFVMGIDILDFINIVDAPELKEVYENVKPTQASIDLTYSKIMEFIGHTDRLKDNAVIRAVRGKMSNANQVLQCIAPRGFVTDVDSIIFPNPIMRGFVQGIRSLHDSIIESRSAAKALYFSEEPLEQAEYFARRLQLLTMTLENVHHGDCGSTKYLNWMLRGPVHEKGKMVYSGDLRYMVGKYYLDEATNTLKVLQESDTHLYGKTIKIRSIVAGCNHPDPHGVCSVCLGEISQNHTPDGNIGNAAAGTMTQQSSQSVLSTKHYDGSSVIDSIVIPEAGKDYIESTKDGNSYLIKESVKKNGYKLIISSNEARGLTDVLLVDDVYDMSISRISEIEYIGIVGKDGVVSTIPVFLNNRYANLTHEFLEYAKLNRWTMDQNDNFVFDLSSWDCKKPIMSLPAKQFNMAAHSSISKF